MLHTIRTHLRDFVEKRNGHFAIPPLIDVLPSSLRSLTLTSHVNCVEAWKQGEARATTYSSRDAMIEFLERLLDTIEAFPHLQEVIYAYEMYNRRFSCKCPFTRDGFPTDWIFPDELDLESIMAYIEDEESWRKAEKLKASKLENGIQLNVKDFFDGLCMYHSKWQDLNPLMDENGSAARLETVCLSLKRKGVRVLMVAENLADMTLMPRTRRW